MSSSSHARNTQDGWTVDQGLASQYAAQAGVNPDLAAEAGEEVWHVLKSLRDATSETDPQRQAKRVRRTKTRLAKVLLSKAGLSRHGALVQHIEAKLLALQGRGGDTELAHLTPGEMIVPPQLQTPEVVRALQQAAHNAGIDLRRYTAGSSASRVNPETGLEEFSVECADEAGCRQDPMGYRGPNIYDYGGTTYVNVSDTSTSPTGQYDAYSADNWAGGPGGSGSGGFGSGGVPYGPESEETDPIEEIVVTAPHPDHPNNPQLPLDPVQFNEAGFITDWLGNLVADVPRTGWPRHQLKCQEAIDRGADQDTVDSYCNEKLTWDIVPILPNLDDLKSRPIEELEEERAKLLRERNIVWGVDKLNPITILGGYTRSALDRYDDAIAVYDQVLGPRQPIIQN